MLIRNKPRWALAECEATPEDVFFNRRAFLRTSGLALGAATLGLAGCDSGNEATAQESDGVPEGVSPEDRTLELYPARRNPAFTLERDLTPESVSSKYNNFYEFGSHKTIWRAAQKLPTRPWEVAIDGEVAKPQILGIDDLILKMPLEERLYRHRCVEAWAMAVPWTGFPMKELVKLAEPTSKARYVRMETFEDPEVAPGQREFWYPWPYVEGLTVEEAQNDLAFLVTGVYGKPLLKQFGAPLRLAVPWKYGFKSTKSIVRFTFTSERPVSFWEKTGPSEYGFWANVNPDVPHRRWSQKTEELLGTGKRVPTQIYNGYGAEVAGLYKDLKGEKLFM